jgi:hypothetical protein
MLGRLPLGFMAGLRVRELDLGTGHCVASVPYGWRTRNPFRSTYFAALTMAAELSTGALAMLACAAAPVSVALLVVGIEGEFSRKATGTTYFTCEDGEAIFQVVADAVDSRDPELASVNTVGRLADGIEVARFRIHWSFKRR